MRFPLPSFAGSTPPHLGSDSSFLDSLSSKIPVDFKYTTGIHQLFGGRLRSRVQCTRCKHNSDTFDAFLDLSIEVRGCRSVRGGFEKFVKPDTLDGQNKYKCEK